MRLGETWEGATSHSTEQQPPQPFGCDPGTDCIILLTMRRLVYSVATSLDGFIAGPKGEFDWIDHDPAIDFAAIYRQFDTFLMGRLTDELAQSQKPMLKKMGIEVVVVSTTLNPAQHEDVTVVSSGVAEKRWLRSRPKRAKTSGSSAEECSSAVWSMRDSSIRSI